MAEAEVESWKTEGYDAGKDGRYTFTAVLKENDGIADAQRLLSHVTVVLDSAVLGDLDGSGEVTIQDVMEACKILARQSAGKAPTGDELARGDLDGDGKITITDVMEICKLLARKA
ncbi:MAG: hypothetical protein HFE86_00725 [Clostridiales bacterium]|nr:hypothetical protein [Clostridiales bacterium]